MKVQIEVEIPEGYEFVRYDVPKNGELYISTKYSQVLRYDFRDSFKEKLIILKEKEPKVIKVNEDKFLLTLNRHEIQCINDYFKSYKFCPLLIKEIDNAIMAR